MTEKMRKAITNYLEDNISEALDLAREMNGWDGSNDWTETYDWDWLCEDAAERGPGAVDDLVRAAVYGDTYGGTVRYDGYGNIIDGSEETLLQDAQNYLSDIINDFDDYLDASGYVTHLKISYDFQEIIDDACHNEVTIRVFDIHYDIDDDDLFDIYPKATIMAEDEIEEAKARLTKELPSELKFTMTVNDPDDIDEDEITDLISDETGWLVSHFDYEVIEVQ